MLAGIRVTEFIDANPVLLLHHLGGRGWDQPYFWKEAVLFLVGLELTAIRTTSSIYFILPASLLVDLFPHFLAASNTIFIFPLRLMCYFCTEISSCKRLRQKENQISKVYILRIIEIDSGITYFLGQEVIFVCQNQKKSLKCWISPSYHHSD